MTSPITYNPETGHFFRNGERCDWENRAVVKRKYGVRLRITRRVRFKGQTIFAHRLAWFLMTGNWPSKDVDHRNRISDDNRWSNLRLADESENTANSYHPLNTSGERNVTWCKSHNCWQVQVFKRGYYCRGDASHKLSAILAARLIRRLLHGQYCAE